MLGFLKTHIPVLIRQLITMVPAIIVIRIGLDPTRTLVMFTRDKIIMGEMVNKPVTTAFGEVMG